MKIRIISIVFCMLLFFCSCHFNIEPSKIQVNDNKNEELKLYRNKNNTFMDKCVNTFNKLYTNIRLNCIVFNSYDDYINKLSTEIMSGAGPDIIYAEANCFKSFAKMARTNAFHDLQSFITHDEDLKLSEFNKNIFDCGLINNKRYYIPVEYFVFMYWTTDDTINKNIVKYGNFGEYLKRIKESVGNEESNSYEKYYYVGEIMPYVFLFNLGFKLIDFNTNKAYFNTRDFIIMLDYYKKFYELTASKEDEYSRYKDKRYGMIADKAALAKISYSLLNPTCLWFENSFARQKFNKDITINGFPDYYGKKTYTAFPYFVLAINNNSRCKEEAFCFIKLALSKDIQTEEAESNSGLIPVNNMALKSVYGKYEQYVKPVYIDNIPSSEIVDGVIPSRIPEKLTSEAMNILKNIEKCQLMDYDIFNVINEEVNKYIVGKQSAEDCAKIIQNKVMIYLNE